MAVGWGAYADGAEKGMSPMLLRALITAVAVFVSSQALAAAGDNQVGETPAGGAQTDGAPAKKAQTDKKPTGVIHVELNKLQQVKGACRAYLVTQNFTQLRLKSLKLDVVMFDSNGIVAKRLAVQIGPMPKGKTSLKVFDIQGLSCDDIGQLLLNGVLECKDNKGTRNDCLAMISVSHRGSVAFIE
jgi:hypothetical protein